MRYSPFSATSSMKLSSSSIIMFQSTEAHGRISFPGFARCLHLESGALFLYVLVSGSFFLGVWVLHVEYGTLDSSGDDFVCAVQCLARRWLHVLHQYLAFGRIAHIFYVAVDSNSEVFGLLSNAE